MAYEVVMPYHLHMPSYFLETFTEYPDENIEIINYNKKRGSAASFFAVEPLFYSHSTPPYHKVVYTNASTA